VAEAAMRTQQDNDLAVACGLGYAAILERAVATGDALPALLDWAAASETVPPEARACAAAAAAAAASSRDVRELGLEFGLSCGLPGALTLALTIVGRHGDDFVAAQRANMLAGGVLTASVHNRPSRDDLSTVDRPAAELKPPLRLLHPPLAVVKRSKRQAHVRAPGCAPGHSLQVLACFGTPQLDLC
jgi:ADP-ribosylglycohydrolase